MHLQHSNDSIFVLNKLCPKCIYLQYEHLMKSLEYN